MTIDLQDRRLPVRVRSIIAKLIDGQRLCKAFRFKESGETEVGFTFEPSGKRCGPKSAQAAIDSGLLKPLGDGLFGESQTWTAP